MVADENRTVRRRTDEDRDLLALAVAKLAARGMLQKAIAAELEISQPEVSRLLATAKRRGWLISEPSLVRHKIPPRLWSRMEQAYFAHPGIGERVQKWAPAGHFVEVRPIHVEMEDGFGRAAADTAADVVLKAATLGVMWGRSIAELVKGFARVFINPPRASKLMHVLPLSGEPQFAMTGQMLEFSSTYLARRLELLINGFAVEGPSLIGVPAYVPTGFSPAEAAAVRRFLGMMSGYQSIYGGDGSTGGLIEAVDTILTGIGVLDRGGDEPHTGVFLTERLARESISEDELRQLVFGDIGGILIERPSLTRTQQRKVDGLNAGWTGLQAENLRACAGQAAKGGAPGVIVVAQGKTKAELLREVVRRGLVNVLVIDIALADALEALD